MAGDKKYGKKQDKSFTDFPGGAYGRYFMKDINTILNMTTRGDEGRDMSFEQLVSTPSEAVRQKYNPNKGEGVEKIRFSIENLLSADNLMDNDSVAVLQDKLNKYVYGSDFLRVDGELGFQTDKAIKKYRNESRYWGGHSAVDINPERTYQKYKEQK